MLIIQALKSLRHDDHEFEIILYYTIKCCQKKILFITSITHKIRRVLGALHLGIRTHYLFIDMDMIMKHTHPPPWLKITNVSIENYRLLKDALVW